MTSTEIETRLFATHHLGRLIHENQNLQDWALQLLITQLYDTSIEVCDIAVMYLEEIGTDPVALEKVVEFQPCLEHLDDIGYPLFMRYVNTSGREDGDEVLMDVDSFPLLLDSSIYIELDILIKNWRIGFRSVHDFDPMPGMILIGIRKGIYFMLLKWRLS